MRFYSSSFLLSLLARVRGRALPENDKSVYLPKGTLPSLSYLPAGQSVEWLNGTQDSERNYRTNGGHPVYGEHDITYRFNSRGYRSVEFDTRADVRILAIGCSYVMGIGMREKDLFHEVFAEKLRLETNKSVAVLNLGAPGGSNDYISRLLHLAVPLLNPTVVLINFTHAGRREYVSVESQLLTYVPGYRPDELVTKKIYEHMDALNSAFDNDLNLYRNYKSIESLLTNKPWLFSSITGIDFERIGDHIDSTRYVGPMPHLDKGRDWCHPGPQSHASLADSYWRRFVVNGNLCCM